MRNKKKYLKFYEDCMTTGELPDYGLCNSIESYDGELMLFEPPSGLFSPYDYWGFGENPEHLSSYVVATKFTTLRQTIVLLLAAMNDEL